LPGGFEQPVGICFQIRVRSETDLSIVPSLHEVNRNSGRALSGRSGHVETSRVNFLNSGTTGRKSLQEIGAVICRFLL
jgi:hypothetical protein